MHIIWKNLSPRVAYETGMAKGGQRKNCAVRYDKEFLLFTYPTPKRPKVKVIPGRGIKVNYIYYWSNEMRKPEIENSKVEVRYDPFNIGHVFARIDGRFVECISELYKLFNGMTERQLKTLTQLIIKHYREHHINSAITAHSISEFYSSVKSEEIELQRRRDQISKNERTLMTDYQGSEPPNKSISPSLTKGVTEVNDSASSETAEREDNYVDPVNWTWDDLETYSEL